MKQIGICHEIVTIRNENVKSNQIVSEISIQIRFIRPDSTLNIQMKKTQGTNLVGRNGLEIEISESCYGSLRFYNFVTNSLRIPICFIRPDSALVFLHFYIKGEIWSNETDWNSNEIVTNL